MYFESPHAWTRARLGQVILGAGSFLYSCVSTEESVRTAEERLAELRLTTVLSGPIWTDLVQNRNVIFS